MDRLIMEFKSVKPTKAFIHRRGNRRAELFPESIDVLDSASKLLDHCVIGDEIRRHHRIQYRERYLNGMVVTIEHYDPELCIS